MIDVVVWVLKLSVGEVETGGFLELAGQPAEPP